MSRRMFVVVVAVALLSQGVLAVVPHHHEDERLELGLDHHQHDAPCLVSPIELETDDCLACSVGPVSALEGGGGSRAGLVLLPAAITSRCAGVRDNLRVLELRLRGPPVV